MEVYNETITTFVIYNEVASILEEFDFPYCVVKGKPLSKQAYCDYSMRKCSDVDFLLSKKNIVDFEKILQKRNFSTSFNKREDRILCLSSSHQIPPYRKLRGGIQIEIDLNFDILWGEYQGKRIDISEFLSDTVDMDIYGNRVKTLPPLKAMVQLILHHYKEMNSIYHLAGHNCINYNMFRDVYYLWKNNQEAISLEKLYAISLEYEIIQYVFYVLYFTNWIFEDIKLQKYVDIFRTSEGESLLDYYGLAENERKVWKVDFQTRLEADDMYNLIKDDLTEADFEKLNRNRHIFG